MIGKVGMSPAFGGRIVVLYYNDRRVNTPGAPSGSESNHSMGCTVREFFSVTSDSAIVFG